MFKTEVRGSVEPGQEFFERVLDQVEHDLRDRVRPHLGHEVRGPLDPHERLRVAQPPGPRLADPRREDRGSSSPNAERQPTPGLEGPVTFVRGADRHGGIGDRVDGVSELASGAEPVGGWVRTGSGCLIF